MAGREVENHPSHSAPAVPILILARARCPSGRRPSGCVFLECCSAATPMHLGNKNAPPRRGQDGSEESPNKGAERISESLSLEQGPTSGAAQARRVIQPRTRQGVSELMIDIPRGKYLGKALGNPPKDEAEQFVRSPACGGWIDCRDLGQVFEHEGPLPHPAQDRPQ